MKRGCPASLWVPAMWVLTGTTAVAQGVPSVDACISRLDPQVDIGYDRIAARCPELMRQLEQGEWSKWLPHGWKEPGNDLSAGSLREFRDLAGRETVAVRSMRTPDVRGLSAVLAKLGKTAATREGGWSRFKTWLRSVLESRAQPAGDNWFTRMVAHVGFSQSVLELVSYGALAAVVALAGLIVLNELRAAGLLPKKDRVARPRVSREAPIVGRRWSDIEQASFRDQPRLLLELIVLRLSERGCLPPAAALTVRELTRAARLPQVDDRTRLENLALAAERVRFSDREIPAGGLDESLIRGRELLDRLDASTPQ